MRINWLVFTLFAIVCSSRLFAQNYSLYDGYFFNPFIYNPAAAATERVQVNAGYRQQWVGISGAPTVFTLTGTTLINNTRMGVGVKINSVSRGFLTTTEASASFAYGIPLSSSSKLYFGLSQGVVSTNVNLNDVANVNDPALGNLTSSLIPSESFGVLFTSAIGLNLGLTLPKLITDQQLNSKYSFSYFDNAIFAASFSRWDPRPKVIKKGKGRVVKSKKNANIPIEGFGLYRYSAYGSSFEVTGKYNFNPNIWLSASYRQYVGVIPGIGLSTGDLSLSYFYEAGFGGDLPLKTHDIQLGLKIGSSKKFRDKPKPVQPAKTTPAPPQQQPKAIAKKPETKPVDTKVAPQTTKPEVVTKKPDVVTKSEPEKKPEVVAKTEPEKKPDVVAKNDTAAVRHRARLQQRVEPLDSATNSEHEAERKQLDKHIEEHSDGKHDDPHNEKPNERHDFVKRGTHHEELDAATYVISGAFKSRVNAEHYSKALNSLGYKADFGHLSVRNIWYVFVAQEDTIDGAKQSRDTLRKNKILSQVWLLTVQE